MLSRIKGYTQFVPSLFLIYLGMPKEDAGVSENGMESWELPYVLKEYLLRALHAALGMLAYGST